MKRTSFIIGTLCLWSGVAWGAEPPCSLTVTEANIETEWKVVDANGDAYLFNWNASEDAAVYTQNKSGAANDWIISPAVTLTAGHSYKVVASVRNMTTFSSDKQDFTVYGGTSQEVAAMTEKIFTVTGLQKSTWFVDKDGTFSPAESGEYYIGLNLTSKSYMGDFGFKSFTITEIVAHPGAVSGLTVTPGAEGALEAILTWTWPDKTDLGGALSSITGAYIYRGTSSTFTANESTLIGTLDAAATPGTQGTYTDTTVPASGKYYYRVVPFNDNGASTSTAPAVQSPFIGMATSFSNVTNVKATAVPDSETSVIVTWDAPTASEGYFNPDLATYTITRYKDGSSSGTVLAEGVTGLSYTDDTIDGLGSYVYGIKTTYNGTTSWSDSKSNAVVTGGGLSLPYSNTFSSSADIALWTLFHGADGKRDWGISSSQLDYWGGPIADAWAVTPKFQLKAGSTYQIAFDTKVSRSASPKNLSVYIGTSPTAEALETYQLFAETINSTYAARKTIVFSVAEDGYYYIAFRCDGESDSNDIYVDNLLIEETVTVPAAAEELTATAAAEGEMKVDLTWTNPTLNSAGNPLETITAVELKRGDTVIETIQGAEPGSSGTYTDTVETPGIYTYSVTVYLDENASESVEATTAWVGPDTPKAPASVSVALDESGARIVTFDPVTEGENGGYIDIANLRYTVSRNGETLDSELVGSPYTDEQGGLPLAKYVYAVSATCGAYTGQATESEGVIFGDAIELPYEPDFLTADAFDLWTLGNWKYNKNKQALDQSSSSESWAFTPPLKMQEGTASVTIKATCYNYRYPEKFDIYLVKEPVVPIEGTAIATDIDVTSVSYPSAQTYEFDVPEGGTYYVAFGQPGGASWSLYLTEADVIQTNVTTAIDHIEGDTTAKAPRYFNLQGVELANPAKGQIVIEVTDKAVKKVF